MEHTTASVHRRGVTRVTAIGMTINLALAGGKIAVGLGGASHALVADGIHSLSDTLTDLAIIVGVRFWTQPADPEHPHGHQRLETLVTLCIGLLLGAVAIGVLYRAFVEIGGASMLAPHPLALAVAAGAIVIKEWLYRWTRREGIRLHSMPLIANAWHHRSDALSSLPVAAAVGVSLIAPGLAVVDQLGAMLVALFIFHAAWRIVRPALGKLLDSGAPPEVLDEIDRIAGTTDRVRRAHAIRTRYIGCSRLAVDLHILVDGALSVKEGHDVATAVKRRLETEGPGIADVVVHIEPDDHDAPQVPRSSSGKRGGR
ncbi:MAG: cation diffusion facilitator family transporter [Planctomycetota bacterium]